MLIEEVDLALRHPDNMDKTILDHIKEGTRGASKIWVIRTLRIHYGYGVMEAMTLYDTTIITWIKQIIEALPFKELPKYVNSHKLYKKAVLERLQKGN